MDKYDDAAMDCPLPLCIYWKELASAFRWYDTQREKETCEWMWDDMRNEATTQCGNTYAGLIYAGATTINMDFCPACGRRVVEKEDIK